MDRGVASSADEEEKDDAEANEGASLRERDAFFLPPPPHDRFGDGMESFRANEGTESFILARGWRLGG
jgi:hypothetical protein